MQPEHALAIVGRALNRAASAPGGLPSNRALRAAVACLLAVPPVPALAAERARLVDSLHLHGVVAWTMAAAVLCAVAVLLSAVVDHYDPRDNGAAYQRFAARGYQAAWTLGVVAMLLHGVTLLLVQIKG